MSKYLLVGLFFILGCRSAPFKVQSLTVKEPPTVAESEKSELNLDEGLASRYKKAKKPSFAIISGFYSLPKTKPFGASGIVQSYSYQLYFEVGKSEQKPFAVVPMSGDEARARDKAINKLLDIGVKIKDISMSDAVNIAQAESKAEKSGKIFKPSQVLTPDVDYLMSIYPSRSKDGPVLVGRVIRVDGTLLAFRVVEHQEVDRLIISLFEDTLSRIGL